MYFILTVSNAKKRNVKQNPWKKIKENSSMRNVVSLSTYLKSYNLKRADFDKEIEKDRDYFDKYIEWGKKKDGSDTILPPQVLTRLGKVFNEKVSEMTITRDGEVRDTVQLFSLDDSEKRGKQMDMSEFMDKPVDEVKEEKKASVKSQSGVKKKKSKLNITKQFIQEHGKADIMDKDFLKSLRRFLLNNGSYKAEDIALMGDEEVQAAFGKDFYVIRAEEGTYFIKRSALVGIMSDVYVVGKE